MSSAAESSRPLGMNLDFTDWTTGSTNQLWPQETCFFFIIICLSLFFSLYSFLKYGQLDLSKARSTKDTARRRGLKDSNHMKIIQRRKCQKKGGATWRKGTLRIRSSRGCVGVAACQWRVGGDLQVVTHTPDSWWSYTISDHAKPSNAMPNQMIPCQTM